MTPAVHLLSGYLLGAALGQGSERRWVMGAALLGAIAPDFDVAAGLLGGWQGAGLHRGATHSFLGAVGFATLAGAVRHLEVLAEEKRQCVSLEANGAVETRADRLVLRQAIINILDNAIKYSAVGSPIRVVVGGQAGAAILEIIDQGPGIGPEHAALVFDRFYRIDKARSREFGGAGLGLSIARWAVECHGGRIELESKEACGSTFRIVLPVPRAHWQQPE